MLGRNVTLVESRPDDMPTVTYNGRTLRDYSKPQPIKTRTAKNSIGELDLNEQ